MNKFEFPEERKGYPLRYSGLESSMDYSPWGCKESDMTEWFSLHMNKFVEVIKSPQSADLN